MSSDWWNQQSYTSSSRSDRRPPRTSSYHHDLNSKSYSTNNLSYDQYNDRRYTSRSPRPPRKRRSWPPGPHVEDEEISLAREIGGHKALVTHDPPEKGRIDQQPILYESELSAAEVASSEALDVILASNRREDARARKGFGAQQNGDKKEAAGPNTEKARGREEDSTTTKTATGRQTRSHSRGGLGRVDSYKEIDYYSDVRKNGTEEGERGGEGGRDKGEENKEINYYADAQQPVSEGRRRRHERSRDPHDRPRRRSRVDLPTLATNLTVDQPPPQRSPSPYSYTPRVREDLSKPGPSRSAFLSPDISARPRSRGGDDYFGQSSRRTGSSRPTTPTDARTPRFSAPNLRRAESDFSSYSPRTREKKTRPGQLVDEEAGRYRRPGHERRPSYEGRGHSRQDSSQSSKTNSDLDDDSAEAEQRRRDERRRRREERNRQETLHPYPLDDPGRGHRRTRSRDDRDSRLANEFSKPTKRMSSPLPSPSITGPAMGLGLGAGLAARNMFDQRRADTFPPTVKERTPTSSRPVSPFDGRFTKTPTPQDHQALSLPVRGKDSTTLEMPASPALDYWQRHHPASPSTPTPKRQNLVDHHLDPPTMGSYRRHSLDQSAGISPIAPCPRTTPVAGKLDWLTLPRCPGFNICPRCYTGTVERTQFGKDFVPRPFANIGAEVVCDFGSQAWYRIAWLMVQKNRERDLGLIYRVAEIGADWKLEACVGSFPAIRNWYGVVDPARGKIVEGFDICPACVQIVTAVLPQLEGIFVEKPGSKKERVCDMRFDTERFIHYFDALELVAEQTPRHLGRYLPDISLFVEVVKKLAPAAMAKAKSASASSSDVSSTSTPKKPRTRPQTPCERDQPLKSTEWWVIAQLPELTVCKSCFSDVVKPESERGRALPRMFELERRDGRTSCQLYSDRMRRVFTDAVESDDFVRLARAARERREREGEYAGDMEFAARFRGERREEEEAKAERSWRKWE